MKRREDKISPCLNALWTSKEYGLSFIKKRKEKKNCESQSQIHFLHFSPKPNLRIKCIRKKKSFLIWAYALFYFKLVARAPIEF